MFSHHCKCKGRCTIPLFDYYCLKCNRIYEIIVPLSKIKEEIICPCCKKALQKRISP
ncbi:zinc ribbon domain-containing protein, partial [bacterium]|nr:zinc ribbon domain-containing protein [bacterium]